ncbi:hypothetical protein QWY31_15085 [Cytophagales bacterium LB-30]|uniref:DUF1579 domain-containing protein n=1 Tax=Shiella aurantiaca TaxID=3058365 RepID=A0ABT8F8Y8_9BACT|nr:hypothetical protein [Shiella aurantiaca]MDN4166834.1 hypothetical protein [Shiella aurantiaca]
MKTLLFTCSLCLGLMAAQAQMTAEEAMKKLHFLEGEWQGKAWTSMGKGQEYTLDQHEKVQLKLNGTVVQVEGIGRENGAVAFQALGLMSYNTYKQAYEFRAYRDNGLFTDAYLEVKGDKNLEWGFSIPSGGKIKYVIQINEQGQWYEIGHYSPDGNNWYKTFEMTLDKI